jgi:histidine triad (HIT) family protein
MAYDRSNIFAKILRGEIPCKKVYEDDYVFAFEDITPSAPVHVLVVPKGEFSSFDDFAVNASADMVRGFFGGVQKIASKLGLQQNGYRIITNHGPDASQTVHHFHVHILGGKSLGKLLS